jgi:hypothetical protein
MMIVRRIRFLAVALALSLAALGLGREAYAGALQIRDPAHLLSAEDAGRLRSAIADAPFVGRLVVTTEFSDAQDLSRFVGSLVVEPNMVVVGLDPQHRHVQVHFGTASRIARSEWPAIERAGNDAFRRGDWEGGVAAIFHAAAGAVSNAPSNGAPVADGARHSLLGPGTLLLLVLGALGIGLYFAWRRSTYAGMGSQPYGGYGAPPYPGGGYPPGYPPAQGGLGPMGGGLIGAGLGGLAGYELGKMEGEREDRERGREGVGGSGGDDGGGNYDEGGGGSGWDDGGGGGFDGGGGGDGGGGDF